MLRGKKSLPVCMCCKPSFHNTALLLYSSYVWVWLCEVPTEVICWTPWWPHFYSCCKIIVISLALSPHHLAVGSCIIIILTPSAIWRACIFSSDERHSVAVGSYFVVTYYRCLTLKPFPSHQVPYWCKFNKIQHSSGLCWNCIPV